MADFEIKLRESSEELTKRNLVKMKDMTNATQLDKAIENGASVAIDVSMYAIFDVHNEHARDKKDYVKLVLVDKVDNKYVTGSETFMRNFLDIWNDMDGEDVSIEVYGVDSKNYPGKQFVTCSLI